MMRLDRITTCRGCGAEIAFIKTTKGKSMPVTPEAVTFIDGGGPNTYVMADGSVRRGRSPEYGDRGELMTGYISHFATCPEADRFHKKRKSDRV